jgi:hypothetical protein
MGSDQIEVDGSINRVRLADDHQIPSRLRVVMCTGDVKCHPRSQ